MLVRIAFLTLILTAPAWAQDQKRPLFAPKPPKPKVVAAPASVPPQPVVATPAPPPTPAAAAPTPRPRRPRPKPTATTTAAAAVPANNNAASAPPLPTAAAPTAPAVQPPPPPRRKPRSSTSLNAYIPSVKAAFSARWAEAIEPAMKNFVPGRLQALFKLDAEGHVIDFTVTENTSNDAFAKFCEQFVRETPLEKPPENALSDGQAEIPFTFAIY